MAQIELPKHELPAAKTLVQAFLREIQQLSPEGQLVAAMEMIKALQPQISELKQRAKGD